MARRTASLQWRVVLMSHPSQATHLHEAPWINLPKTGTWTEDPKEDPTFVGSAHWGHPHPISIDSGGGSDGGTATFQPGTYLSPQSSHTWIGLLLSSMNSRWSTTCTKDAELYKC